MFPRYSGGAEFEGLRLAEPKLEKVNDHEGPQGDARNGQIQLARGHNVVDGDARGISRSR